MEGVKVLLQELKSDVAELHSMLYRVEEKQNEIDKRLVRIETAVHGNGTDGLYKIVQHNRKRIDKINGFITKVALWFTIIGIVLGLVAHKITGLIRL